MVSATLQRRKGLAMITKKFLRKVASERTVITGNNIYSATMRTNAVNKLYIVVEQYGKAGTSHTPRKTVATFDYDTGWKLKRGR